METDRTQVSSTPARRFVVGVAMAFAGMVLIQPLAVWLLGWLPEGGARAAMHWTIAAALVGIAAALPVSRPRATLTAVLAGGLALGALSLSTPGGWIPGLSLPFLGALLAHLAGRLARRLPGEIEHFVSSRRLLAALWAIAAIASLGQTARLAAFAGDASRSFIVGTDNPFWYGHLCLPAYLHGAELALDGEENLYAAKHWPGLDNQAEPTTRFAGMTIEDPYQYPPQFLLLPALGVALTARWDLLLAVWFTLNVGLVLAGYVALASWIGGRSGSVAIWLLPAVVMSFPVVYNFQFGQFHLAAISLSVLAMVAFARGRRIAGAGLLAVAVLAKVFPAILAAYLAGRGRWRELVAFLVACVLITGLAFAVFGAAPFVAFVDYQLPRLSDGSAFAFDEAWPEVSELVIADNQGIFGLARKFGATKAAAARASRVFALLLAATAIWLGRSKRDRHELDAGWTWLALLGLGSLASPGAWGDYVPSVAIWLLALVAARGAGAARVALFLGIAGLFQYFLLGTFPWGPPVWMIPISAVGAFGLLLVYVWALLSANRPAGGEEALGRSSSGWMRPGSA